MIHLVKEQGWCVRILDQESSGQLALIDKLIRFKYDHKLIIGKHLGTNSSLQSVTIDLLTELHDAKYHLSGSR